MTSKPSAREQANRRWFKAPLTFREIDQLETLQERAAAMLELVLETETAERAKRRPNQRLLAKIVKRRQSLEQLAASPPPGGPASA